MSPELKEYFWRNAGVMAVVAAVISIIAIDASISEKKGDIIKFARAAEADSWDTNPPANTEAAVPTDVAARDVPTTNVDPVELNVDGNSVGDVPETPDKAGIVPSWIPQTGSLVYCAEMGLGDGEYLFPASVIKTLLDQGIILYSPGVYVRVAEDGAAEIVPSLGNDIVPTTTGETCGFAQNLVRQ